MTAVAVMAFGFASAQMEEEGLKAGIHLGAPIGNAADFTSFNFGVDVGYSWDTADNMSLGIATGYTHFIGKEYTAEGVFETGEAKDLGYVPVAGTVHYSLTESIFLGADVGAVFYVGSGSADNGLYLQPKAGYQTEKMEFFVSYKSMDIADGIATVGIGAAYKF